MKKKKKKKKVSVQPEEITEEEVLRSLQDAVVARTTVPRGWIPLLQLVQGVPGSSVAAIRSRFQRGITKLGIETEARVLGGKMGLILRLSDAKRLVDSLF